MLLFSRVENFHILFSTFQTINLNDLNIYFTFEFNWFCFAFCAWLYWLTNQIKKKKYNKKNVRIIYNILFWAYTWASVCVFVYVQNSKENFFLLYFSRSLIVDCMRLVLFPFLHEARYIFYIFFFRRSLIFDLYSAHWQFSYLIACHICVW